MTRRLFHTIFAALLLLGAASPLDAQYFGRNKVQYEQFDFRVLETPHFRLHFYPEEEAPARDMARMAARWKSRKLAPGRRVAIAASWASYTSS